jgi:hypothetical protein
MPLNERLKLSTLSSDAPQVALRALVKRKPGSTNLSRSVDQYPSDLTLVFRSA